MRVLMLGMVGTGLAGVLTTGTVRTAGRVAGPGDDPSPPVVAGRLVGPSPLLPRMGARYDVIEAAAGGRMGLWEAADRLRGLYSGDPDFVRTLRGAWPAAADDDERYAGMVINGVRSLFRDRPDERAARAAPLEAELARGRSTERPRRSA
jgi:hypothetical protein